METVNKKFSEIKVGDKIIGSDGKPVVVTHVFDKYTPKDMYELTMADGQTVKCSGNHLWYCETTTDNKERKVYLKLAKHYFKHNKIPDYDPLMPAYPLEIIASKFTADKKSQELITRVCLSMGPTYQTPNAHFDGLEYVGENKFYTYGFNDIIDFLKKLQRVVNNEDQYFYFGKTRETSTIVDLVSRGEEINIPETTEVEHKN